MQQEKKTNSRPLEVSNFSLLWNLSGRKGQPCAEHYALNTAAICWRCLEYPKTWYWKEATMQTTFTNWRPRRDLSVWEVWLRIRDSWNFYTNSRTITTLRNTKFTKCFTTELNPRPPPHLLLNGNVSKHFGRNEVFTPPCICPSWLR